MKGPRRTWAWMAPALVLAAPALAGNAGGAPPGQEAGRGQGMRQQEVFRGLVQGTVGSVDLSAGKLSISAGQQGDILLHGTPSQLQMYRQGEFTSVPYAEYAGHRWVLSQPSQPQPQTFARVSTASGAVRSVDVATGTLTLSRDGRTATYRGHPQQLEALRPGQSVQVTYESVGNSEWVQQVRPEPHPAAGQP